MTIKKYAYRAALVGLGSLLGLSLTVSAGWANTLSSQPVEAKENSSGNTLRQGLPGRRLGGGTRGDLVFKNAYAYLAALVTSDNLSQTTAAKPTLLFSIPDLVSAQEAEFILRDSESEEVYRTTFRLNGDAGVVSLDLSKTSIAPLRMNENYRWYFSIVSAQSETHRANDIAVHGNIRRVESASPVASADVTNSLSVEESLVRAKALYKEADLWHDAAVMLYNLRQAHPDDVAIAREWDRLVESAGLSAVLQPSPAMIEVSLKSN